MIPTAANARGLQRLFAGLALALLVAPAALGVVGGADFDLAPGWRVSWYEPLANLAALVVAGAALALAPARGARARLGALAALVCAGVGLLAWFGGIQSDSFSLNAPGPPALVGAALFGLALTRGARFGLSRWQLLPAALGVALLALAQSADRRDLERRVSAARPAASGPDVILIVADTLRADALGAYGVRPSPTPYLDALAARSVRFERAIAQAPWTVPSMWSLMTSLHPSTLDPEGRGASDRAAVGRRPSLALPRLASELQRRGWHTAGFQKNPFLAAGSGFEQGFDVYERVGGETAERESAAQLVDAALTWANAFDEASSSARPPFFLYLHFMDAHMDYQPPAAFVPEEAKRYRGPLDGGAPSLHALLRAGKQPSEADVAQLRALYRGEVAYLDSQLARLSVELASLGLATNETLLVFTADHGEQFGEHGEFEHGAIHRENVQVPLLVSGAGLAPRAMPDVVRLVDVAPTLLALVGAEPLPAAEGRSLAPLLRGEPLAPLAAVTEYGRHTRVTAERYSLLRSPRRARLFDLRGDAGELRNLAPSAREEVAALEAALAAHEARPRRETHAAPRTLDARMRRELEALGYLDEPRNP